MTLCSNTTLPTNQHHARRVPTDRPCRVALCLQLPAHGRLHETLEVHDCSCRNQMSTTKF